VIIKEKIMDNLDLLEARLNQLEDINPSLVSNVPKKVAYPFIEIQSVSKDEFNMFRNLLKEGDVPLMIRSEGKLYPVKNTSLTLDTVKILSSITRKEILIRKSKTSSQSIEEILDYLLMEEYHNV
jgi:hypothetical protein